MFMYPMSYKHVLEPSYGKAQTVLGVFIGLFLAYFLRIVLPIFLVRAYAGGPSIARNTTEGFLLVCIYIYMIAPSSPFWEIGLIHR